MSGIFLEHLTKQGGPQTRLEKAVVAQARAEVLKHYKPGQEVVIKGRRGVVQADGSISPNLVDLVQTGFATKSAKVDITKGRKRSAAYKPGDSRSAEGMKAAQERLAKSRPNSRL